MRATKTVLPLFCSVLALALLFTACSRDESASAAKKKGDKMAIKLSSTAFENGAEIPSKYTGDGRDVSPPLRWEDVPEGTRSLVLICDDPDAPMGTWVHWVIYAIPSDAKELPEAVPARDVIEIGAKQGTNDFRRIGYGGPAPPPGKPHRYFFKLYALDTELDLKAGATKRDLLRAIEGHILAQGELTGTYKR